MRDPESELRNYDSHDIEDGYDTRYLQPDWNNFGHDTEDAESKLSQSQASQTGEFHNNDEKIYGPQLPQTLKQLQPPNSPPQFPYDANFQPSYNRPYPFQLQHPSFNRQEIPNTKNQPDTPGYVYPNSETQSDRGVLPHDGLTPNFEQTIEHPTENLTSTPLLAELQNNAVDQQAVEEKVIHPNLQYPIGDTPSLVQQYYPYSQQSYQPENSFSNFPDQTKSLNKPSWASLEPLQNLNQYGQMVPNQYPNQIYPQYQPNSYYSSFNPMDNQQVIATHPDQYRYTSLQFQFFQFSVLRICLPRCLGQETAM